MKPSIGRVVHYVSYGTPGGEFPSTCRAAVVAAVDPWVETHVDLAVLNPEGLFFNRRVKFHDVEPQAELCGGTWHWPERVEDPAPDSDGLPVDERRDLVDMTVRVERERIATWIRHVSASSIGKEPTVLADRIERGTYS